MKKNLNGLYTWNGKEDKEPTEMFNSGTLLTEQKAENTISEMVETMILSGKMLDLAKARAGNTQQSIDEKTAFETATKIPDLIEKRDIHLAKTKLEKMYSQIEEKEKEKAEIAKIAENLQKLGHSEDVKES